MQRLKISLRAQGGINKYPAKAHAQRVAQALGKADGIILLKGTRAQMYSNSDMPQTFRQDRYFYYLSGCNESDCMLTYDIAKDWLTLYLPSISWTRFYYDGRGSTTQEAEDAYDIDDAKYIPDRSGGAGVFEREWLPKEVCLPTISYVLDQMIAIWTDLCSDDITLDSRSLRPVMDACRAVKDEYEIALIRRANEITAAAHKDVLQELHNCTSEAEAEAVYLRTCIASLAKEQAYEPIFAAGVDASFLHYIQDDKPFSDSQVLLIDAGCEWQRYASDVTRTLPLNKSNPGHWPSREAEQVYAAVERIQKRCIRLMQPGFRFSDVNQTAQHLVIDELLAMGILKGDHNKILETGTHRAFLPHGLGHHLGLEVHDITPRTMSHSVQPSGPREVLPHGGTAYGRPLASDDLPMEAGNVITVEPGIYFNKFVLDRFFLPDEKHARFIDREVLKRYLKVGGVRIEDDILITTHGNENLTTAPKGEEMLQIIRDAASSGKSGWREAISQPFVAETVGSSQIGSPSQTSWRDRISQPGFGQDFDPAHHD